METRVGGFSWVSILHSYSLSILWATEAGWDPAQRLEQMLLTSFEREMNNTAIAFVTNNNML